MSRSQCEEGDDALEKKHGELCAQLNMDEEAAGTSWKNFVSVRQKYTLDGDPVHWLSCALYVACRESLTPTVGATEAAVEGNCVSLTKLLRLCNINLTQFFDNIKKWTEMASMPSDFRRRVDMLERNFAVSSVLYQKFRPIFCKLFVPLEVVEQVKPTKGSKKMKVSPCNVNSVFEFCWCLFICVKGEFPSLSDDLVNMFHVLLSCVDLIFSNAVLDRRTDLLNPDFQGLPADWSSPNFEAPAEPPCVVSTLCELFSGIYVEAKSMKQYSWKIVIEDFFKKSILKGNENNFTGLLSLTNFDFNLKSLNKVYEMYVLSVGEFDERIFLGHQSAGARPGRDTGRASCSSYPTPNIRSLIDDTPLTGRKHLKHKDDIYLTPVSATTHSVQRLHAYLQGHAPQPSNAFQALCRECRENPLEEVVRQQRVMGRQFVTEYSELSSNESIVNNRLQQITTLYYKLLEHIVREEIRKKPTVDLQVQLRQLGQSVFHQTLYACCVEMVIHAYQTQGGRFPWILRCFTIASFDFHKIIELVVLAIKEKLPRDFVKHLNALEEQILESMVWTSDSPLWVAINRLEEVPSWSNVKATDTPTIGQGQVNPSVVSNGSTPSSSSAQATAQTVRRMQVNVQGVPQSPVSSAAERFVSPGTDIARQLFRDTNSIRPGQSLLNHNNQVSSNNAQAAPNTTQAVTNNAQVAPNSTQVATNNAQAAPNNTQPRRKSSIALFLRKFYSLAAVRMKDLCTNLNLRNEELVQKIWTCFEHSIMHQTPLMKDRHLDQILMCVIYIICKVRCDEISFQNIMKCYRQQPQSAPHLYRSVLISSGDQAGVPNNENADNLPRAPVSRRPTSPSHPGGHCVRHASEVRGDLINFYNTVFVHCLQTFALRFRRGNETAPLSPLPPRDRSNVGNQGPWRVSDDHNVFVRSLNSPLRFDENSPQQYNVYLSYQFSRSPAKDLQNINSLVAQEGSISLKRSRDPDDASGLTDGSSDRKFPCTAVRKLNEFIPD